MSLLSIGNGAERDAGYDTDVDHQEGHRGSRVGDDRVLRVMISGFHHDRSNARAILTILNTNAENWALFITGTAMADFPKIDSTTFPLFGHNSVDISSDGKEVKIEPHYRANTGDSMYVSASGSVRTTTFGGYAGASQEQMRGDVLVVLRNAQGQAKGTTAANLAAIIARIEHR